jgi:hypothetical protein
MVTARVRRSLIAAVAAALPGAAAVALLPLHASASSGVAATDLDAAALRVSLVTGDRLAADVLAMKTHRPGYEFWRHVFTIPDGSVAFGSRQDGRLLAVFPTGADWTTSGRWEAPELARLLRGRALPARTPERTDAVARILEAEVGPVIHNGTRGRFLLPNISRYGSFLTDWGVIYERFGVPAEIGLAQAIVESGLAGTIRSEARAVGFCQWLEGNWRKLDRFSPHVLEAGNQTTQAPYCAAYLSILATKYGSFVPALSEHHAGGTNVGRTIIKGERLGGDDVRSQYFLGSAFALALRGLPGRDYSELYRTYGPRSFRYTELVFGNAATVIDLRGSTPQKLIYATRASREITLDEIVRRSGLTVEEIKRYNPALVRRVPANANLYLPKPVTGLGRDVSFWQHPSDPAFSSVLADFLALPPNPEEWDSPRFERVLRDFQRRFQRTGTEEGTVMGVVLEYVIDETRSGRRGEIIAEFRNSARVSRLLEDGVRATRLTRTTHAERAAG